jgi:hypothetical protein
MRAAGLTLLLAATVATALKSLGLTFAGLAHQARAVNDSAAIYRVAMWAVVAVAVNYRHGSPGWGRPGLTGMVFATLSVGSVVGWELRERQTYRALNADRLPARRPRFGYARWIRFPVTTGRALSAAIRDGITDTTTALSAATAETARLRSLAQARRAFGRAGRKLIAQRLAAAGASVAHQRDRPAAAARDPATDVARNGEWELVVSGGRDSRRPDNRGVGRDRAADNRTAEYNRPTDVGPLGRRRSPAAGARSSLALSSDPFAEPATEDLVSPDLRRQGD